MNKFLEFQLNVWVIQWAKFPSKPGEGKGGGGGTGEASV